MQHTIYFMIYPYLLSAIIDWKNNFTLFFLYFIYAESLPHLQSLSSKRIVTNTVYFPLFPRISPSFQGLYKMVIQCAKKKLRVAEPSSV